MAKRRPLTARRAEILRRSAELRRRAGFAGVQRCAPAQHDDRGRWAQPAAGSNETSSSKSAPAEDAMPPMLSTFSRLYESPDGKFCLFEDGYGHLSAVNTARFA